MLAAVAAAAPALLMPAAPAEAQAKRDWSRTAVRTAEGGYRMGNPAATVRLVEYGSITCPHCARFAADSSASLRSRHIRSGRVSFEYRPYLIFPTDPGAFMLLDCLPPGQFFATAERLYAEQPVWSARFRALPQAEVRRIRALGPLQQAGAIAKAAGIDGYFRARGMTARQVDACLADQSRLDRLVAATRRAGALGVQGTPTFFINGLAVGAQDWSALEPMLGEDE